MLADIPPLALFLAGLSIGYILGRPYVRRYYPAESLRFRLVRAQTWCLWAYRTMKGKI